MRKTFVVALCVLFAMSVAMGAMAKNAPSKYTQYKYVDEPQPMTHPTEVGQSMFQAAAATTTVLCWYQFDTGAGAPTKQGWTEHDVTGQMKTFFHVDGAATTGGCHGFAAVAGNKSMWCGQWVTTDDPYCGWAGLPGYGNNWAQNLELKSTFTATTLTYTIMWDSEPGYDFTYVQWWDPTNLVWVNDVNANAAAGSFTSGPANGDPGGPFTETLTSPYGATKVRFHFQSDGAWSDEDGLWDTVGGVNLDDLSTNGGLAEGFETTTCGALQSADGKWVAATTPPFGLYSGLVAGSAIVQEDPCAKPLSNMWKFFDNPAVTNYACGGWPLQGAIPFGPDPNNLYMDNEIWSPWIPVSGSGTSFLIQFLTYRDLPLDNLIFYVWSVRTRDTAAIVNPGCPTTWRDNNNVYYGASKDWLRQSLEIGPYMASTLTDAQIALGAVDMCGVWCGSVGTGACHSHAPLIDQARLVRVGVNGPQWTVRDYHCFQDNFPEEGGISTTSYARCDMALDLLLSTNPNILPGDSMFVVVSDPAGLAIDATGGRSRRAVYAFVKVTDRFGTDRGYTAAQEQSPEIKAYATDVTGLIRWPYVAAVSPAGWNAFRFDYAQTNSGSRVKDGFCVDLMDLGSGATGPHYKHVNENVAANTGLFVPGDVINYVLAAKNVNNEWSYYSRTFKGQGGWFRTSNLNEALASPLEWSVLPDAGRQPGELGDILLVDDGDDRVSPLYFDWAFNALGLTNKVDRFDVLGPSTGGGNSLASRVKNIQQQIIGDPVEVYQKVLWNCTNLSTALMGDGGTPNGGFSSEKSNDFGLCFTFLNQHPDNPGWLYMGDDVAKDWVTLTGAGAVNTRSVYMNFSLTNADQRAITGIVSPKVFPVALSPFVTETFYAYGGCGIINTFDAVAPTGVIAKTAYLYNNNANAPAAVYQATTNAANSTARFLLVGFGYDYIRDDDATPPLDRVNMLKYTLTWFQNTIPAPVGIDPVAFANTLEDNYPNPFNPTTTIKYSIMDRGQVSLKIYNAAGQLVRTLVNEEQAPQAGGFAKVWNGLNDQGQSVASGVYFYQLTAKNFEQTKKMVLLK